MEQIPGPYDSPHFSGDLQAEPNPGPLKTLGVLNIVFSCGLLLCVSCYGFYTFMFAAMNPAMQAAQAQEKAERQQSIDDLKQKIDQETDADKRVELQEELDDLEARPDPVMPDMRKMSGFKDTKVLAFYIVDTASGLILNLLMLIVGCGLLGLREWGRRGGVVLSAIKLIRLVVLYGIGVAVIAPLQGEYIADGLLEIVKQMPQRQQAPQPPAGELAKVYTVMLTGSFLATMLLGAIYPAISLWVLTRDSAKAATSRPID